MKKTILPLRNVWIGATALLPFVAPAANLTWDAAPAQSGVQDGPGIWDATTANWWSGTANVLWSSTVPDVALFGATNGAAGTVTLGADLVSGNIFFNPASAGEYTIAGGSFKLGLTNRTIMANVHGTISADIVGGSVTISHGPQQAPSAVVTLSGANTFTGGVTIGENANNLNGAGAANSSAAVRIASNTALGTGTVNFNGQGNATSPRLEITGGLTVANAITFQGRNNVATGIESFSGANTLTGNISPAPGGSQYPIRVDGASTLTLAGNTTLQTSGPRAFILGGTGTGLVSGNLLGGLNTVATIIVNKSGSGTWTLAGANAYSGVYVLSEGTLNLDYTAQNNAKLSATTPIYLSGGTLNLSGGSFTEVVSSNILSAGAVNLTRSSGSSTVRLNSIVRRAGGVVDFAAAGLADTDTLNSNGILGGYATLAGADWAINSSGAADGAVAAYTGYTDVNALGSTLADNATSNVRLNAAGAGGNIALAAPTTSVNTLLQNTSTAATINTAGGVLRLGSFGGVLIPSGRQSLTIGTAANNGTLTAGSGENTPGEIILINNSANDLTVNATIADNGGGAVSLTKAGSGSATLTGANTHTGTNYVVAGTLNISDASNLGSGSVVINGGTLRSTASPTLFSPVLVGPSSGYGNGTISVASGQALTLAGVLSDNAPYLTGVSLAGSLTKTGPGTLVLAAANTHTLGTIVNEGTLSISADNNLGIFDSPSRNGAFSCFRPDNLILNGGTLEIAGTFTLSANRGIRLGPINGSGTGTISVTDGNIATFNGQISDNWAGSSSFVKAGNGTLVLGGAVNDYSGGTTINAGTVQLGSPRAIPNGPGKGNLTINSGATLNLNNVNANLNGLSGGGLVDNQNSGAVILAVGYNNASSTFAGTIQSTGGGALALNKVGNGTLTLSGTVQHNGATTVNAGVLALSGAAQPSATTNITVTSGATLNVASLSGGLTLNPGQTLSGAGNVVGNVASTGAIAPGSGAGTLALSGNLTLSGGELNYELASVTTTGAGVNDLVTVTGNLAITGPVTLNLAYLNGLPAGSGQYTLITYTGTFSGAAANITVPAGFTINHNVGAKAIELLIDHVPVNLTWRGDGAGNVWDLNTTANWRSGATPTTFFNGDTANFDNTGSNSPAISVTTPIVAAAVNVNASQDYTFTGSSIGAGALTKSGSGTLVLENDNFFTAVTVNSGVLQLGNFGTTGSFGGATVTNNAAVVFNRADTLAVTNTVAGSGSLAQSGSGTVILSASNTYAGLTAINGGILAARNSAALGTSAAGTTVAFGAQLFVDANVSFTNESLTLSGAGPGNGALRKGGAGLTVWDAPINVVSDATLHVDGGATLSLIHASGIAGTDVPVTLAGDGGGVGYILGPLNLGAGSLTKNGGSSWTVAANNIFTGKTTITGGTLFVPTATALGAVTGVTPDYISLSGGSLGVTNDVAFSDGQRGFTANGGAGGFNVGSGATLTVANDITGGGVLTKTGAGTLVLNSAKTFSGTLNPDSASTAANDGVVRLTTAAAVANVASPIVVRNNNSGSSTIELDGASGDISLPQVFRVNCRNVDVPWIRSLTGNNTLAGGVEIEVGGNRSIFQCDAGQLTVSGNITYVGTLTGGRTYVFTGAGNYVVSGVINNSENGAPIGVAKGGPGTLTLAAANTYGNVTIISNGVLNLTGSITSTGGVSVVGGALAGSGVITDNVLVQSSIPSATLDGLTVNGNYTIDGALAVDVNRSGFASDLTTVSGTLSAVSGGIQVNRLGAALQVGDTFVLFNKPVAGGAVLTVTGAGANWINNLAVNGTIQVGSLIPSTPTTITPSVTGNTLTLTWPGTHQGWVLQVQTNALNVGVANNWVDVPGTALVTSTNITINPTNPTVFFRLRSP